MTGRRLLALVGVIGLALAALVLPTVQAEAQQAPVISISPTSDTAGTSGTWSITVSGTGWRAERQLSIQFAGDPAIAYTPPSTNWSRTITPARRLAGFYPVRVVQDLCDFDSCPYTATAQFTAVPQLSLSPTCSTPGRAQTLTVSGVAWNPQYQVTVTYDYPSNFVQLVTPAGNGNFSVAFNVTAPNRDVVVFAEQGRINQSVRELWRPCPPPGSTTTAPTTTTTAPPVIDTTTTTAPTTTRPTVPGSLPTTTLPPTIDIPPPTPGATLVLDPPLGPTGFVTGVVGTGFPPGPVELTWSGGIGTTMTIAGPDGTFSTRALVLPGDRIGPRAMVATGGGTSTFAAFLVVPSTVQPSGQDVLQINRIRRFNNR